MKYQPFRELTFRASYNEAFVPPSIAQLTGGGAQGVGPVIIDSKTGSSYRVNVASGGNPNLTPSTSDNYDVQLEYYTPKGGLYSAGVFYKKLKGFYYSTTLRFTNTDANGYPIPDANGPRI